MKIIFRIFLIFFFTSSIAAAYADDVAVSRRGVLYWEKNGTSYEMRIFLPDERKSIRIAEMEASPQQTFFSEKWDKVYYRIYNKLFRLDWKINTTPVYLLTFPDGCLQGQSSPIWRNRRAEKWRCVIEDTELAKYPVIKKDGQHYLQYKNNLVEINNGYFPQNNIKYALSILNFLEYDDKKGWKEFDYESTTCNASSDPCMDSVKQYRKYSGIVYLDDIVDKTTRLSQKDEYPSYPTQDQKWMFDINPDSGSFVKVNERDFLMYPGLSLVDKNSKNETVILSDSESDFLGLSLYSKYMLVTSTQYLNRGVLVDLNSQEIIFTPPEESPVMWVNIPE